MPTTQSTASVVKAHAEDIKFHVSTKHQAHAEDIKVHGSKKHQEAKDHVNGKVQEVKDHIDNVGDDLESRWQALDAKVDKIAKPAVHSALTPVYLVGGMVVVLLVGGLLGWELAQLLK